MAQLVTASQRCGNTKLMGEVLFISRFTREDWRIVMPGPFWPPMVGSGQKLQGRKQHCGALDIWKLSPRTQRTRWVSRSSVPYECITLWTCRLNLWLLVISIHLGKFLLKSCFSTRGYGFSLLFVCREIAVATWILRIGKKGGCCWETQWETC